MPKADWVDGTTFERLFLLFRKRVGVYFFKRLHNMKNFRRMTFKNRTKLRTRDFFR